MFNFLYKEPVIKNNTLYILTGINLTKKKLEDKNRKLEDK